MDEDIGLNRNHLSKDLQDVYDTLMNFQKRDISTQSYAFPIQNSRSTQNTRSDNVQLSEIMANYGMKLNDENINNTPKKPQKEYFIPVDYETYSKWMQKSQEEEPQPLLGWISIFKYKKIHIA